MRLSNLAALFILISGPSLAAKQDILGIKIGMAREEVLRLAESKGAACTHDAELTWLCRRTENGEAQSLQLEFNCSDNLYFVHYRFVIHESSDEMKRRYIKIYGLTNPHFLAPNYVKPVYNAYGGVTARLDMFPNDGHFALMDLSLAPRLALPPKSTCGNH